MYIVVVLIAMIHEIPFIFSQYQSTASARCTSCPSYLRNVMETTKITIRSTFPKYMPIEMYIIFLLLTQLMNNGRRRMESYHVIYDVTEICADPGVAW